MGPDEGFVRISDAVHLGPEAPFEAAVRARRPGEQGAGAVGQPMMASARVRGAQTAARVDVTSAGERPPSCWVARARS